MAIHTIPYERARSHLARWIGVGALAGAVSVVLFHQSVASLLYGWGLLANPTFSLQPTRPFGLPALWSLVFWGGVWGAVLAASFTRLRGAALLLAAVAFGAVLPTLIASLVVAPLKHATLPVGLVLLVNGAWGLGTGLGLRWFGRPRGEPPAR